MNIHVYIRKLIRFTLMGALIGTLISCASTTTIRVTDSNDSIDKNVKIYLDGSYKGRGEVMYSDTKIVGSTTSVTLKKKGCRSNSHNLSRTEQLQVGALVAGFFVWVPLLWVMGYNPLHSYEFQCDK